MTPLQIIKVGGAVVENEASLAQFLDTVCADNSLKILVHGGGRTATDVAGKLGFPVQMVNGRRITDADMLRVVTMVYGGLVNKNIVAQLQHRGRNAIGLSGADMGCMVSDKRPVGEIDYGFVGDVKRVDASALSMLLDGGYLPVMAPLTMDASNGGLLNTNADTIAAEVAKAMAQHYDVRLTFYFELPGVMLNPTDPSSVLASITRSEFDEYVKSGVVSGGMIPKLENAFSALSKGVARVFISNTEILNG